MNSIFSGSSTLAGADVQAAGHGLGVTELDAHLADLFDLDIQVEMADSHPGQGRSDNCTNNGCSASCLSCGCRADEVG